MFTVIFGLPQLWQEMITFLSRMTMVVIPKASDCCKFYDSFTAWSEVSPSIKPESDKRISMIISMAHDVKPECASCRTTAAIKNQWLNKDQKVVHLTEFIYRHAN
ncbi:hypothetical protein MKX01_014209 [Papaver californicum]|nr:hypothetical protein MKX01_014209 [Papaver californicum]